MSADAVEREPNPDHVIYVSGPMRGYPEANHPAFIAATELLRSRGYMVVSPIEIAALIDSPDIDRTPEMFVADDLRGMLGWFHDEFCNAIALLPGWERSVGARCEVAVAITLGFAFFDAATGEQVPPPAFVLVDRGYSAAPVAVQVESLDMLASAIAVWQSVTFPRSSPASVAAHLVREAAELLADPTDVMQIADVFHLVVAACEQNGVSLADVVAQKFAENRERVWGPPDAEGVVEHVAVQPEVAR